MGSNKWSVQRLGRIAQIVVTIALDVVEKEKHSHRATHTIQRWPDEEMLVVMMLHAGKTQLVCVCDRMPLCIKHGKEPTD